jgi:hypothetical protein
MAANNRNHWNHVREAWEHVEIPFVLTKWTFYNCKWNGICEHSIQDTLFPTKMRKRETPASPAASSGGSSYAPVTNPWGGGFFE